MPAPPQWLLAVPDAIRQLEKLDRDLLTRRDVEKLFGVSRARAAQLMRTFGAEIVGAARVLRRSELLRQLRKYRQRAAFRGEEQRRARLVTELRTARLIRPGTSASQRCASFEGTPFAWCEQRSTAQVFLNGTTRTSRWRARCRRFLASIARFAQRTLKLQQAP